MLRSSGSQQPGVKEDLVARVTDWPGVQSAKALLEGEPLEGVWYNRTARSNARRRGEKVRLADFAEPETVPLTPPCWHGLPASKRVAPARPARVRRRGGRCR